MPKSHSIRSPSDVLLEFTHSSPKTELADIIHHISPHISKHLSRADTKALSQSHPHIGKAIIDDINIKYKIFKPEFVKLLNKFGVILNEIYNIKKYFNNNQPRIHIKIANTEIFVNYIYGLNLSSHISVGTVNPFHFKYRDNINDTINIDALKQYLIKDISKLKKLKNKGINFNYENITIVFSNVYRDNFSIYLKNQNGYKYLKSYKELKEYAIIQDPELLTPIFELLDQLRKVLKSMDKLLEKYNDKLQYFQKRIDSTPNIFAPSAQEGGKLTLRKSSEKVKIGNKERIVYLGAHNKKYIKMNKEIVALKDINRST